MDKIKQKKVIGIVGGMGPFAHIELEQRLLALARELASAAGDQDFPEWVLSSIPQTPDRTLAILGKEPDPTPWLLRSLRRLEPHNDPEGNLVRVADFAVVACNTSHWFLAKVRHMVSLPVLDMVEETGKVIASKYPGSRVGLLATTGTLKTRLYHEILEPLSLHPISLLDLPNGEQLQRSLVMEAIYGPWDGHAHKGGGIKALGPQPEHVESLNKAGDMLVSKLGADIIVLGCTEISVAVQTPEIAGAPCVDPMSVVAELAIRKAYSLDSVS